MFISFLLLFFIFYIVQNVFLHYKKKKLIFSGGRCFLAAWNVSKSVTDFKYDRSKPNLPKRKCISMLIKGLLIGKRPFKQSNTWKTLPFSGHIAKKFRRATILQLNIEDLTASKMKVLHYLDLQSEALVILLQETHCTDAEKLVLPNYQLDGSSLAGSMALTRFYTSD